ncbi:hypothetical protein V6S67_12530 [Arthrobacter sp. Soc17.1.1.1]|uniref:hypothetical protein n=1 Tax=Arthrobacter sp. Soc17.1.1.1 TaxID=3121277 RepID=UPI002FE4D0D3
MAHDDAGSSPVGEGRRSAFPVVPADAAGETGDTGDTGTAVTAARSPGRPAAVVAAAASGIVAAVFGTVLHGQVVHVGSTGLPVGAAAALVLAGSLFLLCGLWARSIIMSAVAGAVAYGAVALLSTSSKTLILTGTSDAAPGTALAGNLWLFGVLVVTLAAVVAGSILLRPARR